MTTDSPGTDEGLSVGLIAYVSGGSRPWPTTDDEVLVDAVGEEVAIDLLPRLRAIVEEAFDVDVDWLSSRREPYDQVQDAMRRSHPELSEEAIQALGRYWSYQTK